MPTWDEEQGTGEAPGTRHENGLLLRTYLTYPAFFPQKQDNFLSQAIE